MFLGVPDPIGEKNCHIGFFNFLFQLKTIGNCCFFDMGGELNELKIVWTCAFVPWQNTKSETMTTYIAFLGIIFSSQHVSFSLSDKTLTCQ